jgi:hypothetical protein
MFLENMEAKTDVLSGYISELFPRPALLILNKLLDVVNGDRGIPYQFLYSVHYTLIDM